MNQTDVSAPMDPTRLGEMVARLPALCRSFGWTNPVSALDYVAAGPEDAELAFVRDLLTICTIGPASDREDAWRRLDARIEAEGSLDLIAAAMS